VPSSYLGGVREKVGRHLPEEDCADGGSVEPVCVIVANVHGGEWGG